MKRVICLARVGNHLRDVNEIGDVIDMPDRMAESHVVAGNVAYVDAAKAAETVPSESAPDPRPPKRSKP